jgi:hypothetical protein
LKRENFRRVWNKLWSRPISAEKNDKRSFVPFERRNIFSTFSKIL